MTNVEQDGKEIKLENGDTSKLSLFGNAIKHGEDNYDVDEVFWSDTAQVDFFDKSVFQFVEAAIKGKVCDTFHTAIALKTYTINGSGEYGDSVRCTCGKTVNCTLSTNMG